jgi:hypothetical protein
MLLLQNQKDPGNTPSTAINRKNAKNEAIENSTAPTVVNRYAKISNIRIRTKRIPIIVKRMMHLALCFNRNTLLDCLTF